MESRKYIFIALQELFKNVLKSNPVVLNQIE